MKTLSDRFAYLEYKHKEDKEKLIKIYDEEEMLSHDIDKHKQAEEVINLALVCTQQGAKTFIEDIVTKALHIVFNEDYQFILNFDIKRNQSEIKLTVKQGKNIFELSELGGSIRDIVSFALRLAFHSLVTNNKSNTFVIDEPARNLGAKRKEFGNFLKEIGEYLGLQIIVVTHSGEIASNADYIYEINYDKGVSNIKQLQ